MCFGRRAIDLPRRQPESISDYMRMYRRTVAHIICESLGYCSPSSATRVLMDAKAGKQNYCEWIFSCYECDPMKPVRLAIKRRHTHRGYMADYRHARALVQRAIDNGEEPVLASWF